MTRSSLEEPASLHWRGVHRAGHQLHKLQQSRGKRLATLPPSAGRSNIQLAQWGAFDNIRQKRKQGYNMMLQIMEMMVDSLMQSDQLTLSLIRIPVSVGLIIPGSVPTFKILW